jgi:hypothetical protein
MITGASLDQDDQMAEFEQLTFRFKKLSLSISGED